MASYTIPSGERAVTNNRLVPGVADTVTVADGYAGLGVISDGLDALYVRIDGTLESLAQIGDRACYAIAAGGTQITIVPPYLTSAGAVVSVISAKPTTYSLALGIEGQFPTVPTGGED